jgi:hypothetical protein
MCKRGVRAFVSTVKEDKMCLIEEPAAEERALLILNKSGEVVEVSLRRIGP